MKYQEVTFSELLGALLEYHPAHQSTCMDIGCLEIIRAAELGQRSEWIGGDFPIGARDTNALHGKALGHLEALRLCMDKMTYPEPQFLIERPISQAGDQLLKQLSILIRTHEMHYINRMKAAAGSFTDPQS